MATALLAIMGPDAHSVAGVGAKMPRKRSEGSPYPIHAARKRHWLAGRLPLRGAKNSSPPNRIPPLSSAYRAFGEARKYTADGAWSSAQRMAREKPVLAIQRHGILRSGISCVKQTKLPLRRARGASMSWAVSIKPRSQ